MAWLRGSVLVSFIKFQSRYQLGLQSSQGLTGAGGTHFQDGDLTKLEAGGLSSLPLRSEGSADVTLRK